MKKGIALCCMLLVFSVVNAQSNYSVLDWDSHTTLYHYITEKLHDQYTHRDSVLDKALRQNTLKKYQQDCRKRYLDILGDFPEKSPLHAQITGVISKESYTIKKVIYQSFPQHHVTANLYIPKGEAPFPAVLFLNGHEATAKATITYQQTAIRFAKNGFVVLSIDPISQGERYQFTDKEGSPLTRGGTTGHTLLDAGANLVGTNVPAYQVWDNERGLDYLCSLDIVDTSRLGCLGNSGGGTQTAYFIPFDNRIKVSAIASYVTKRERTLLLLGPQDGCQWLPDESKAGLDIGDYLIMFAPKPMLILAGRYGFVDYNGTKDVYREVKDVYQHLGEPEKIKLFASDNGHGIQKAKQIAAVQWFRRWFYQDTSSIKGANIQTLPEKKLQVTPTGQVNTAFKNENTIQARNLRLANKWKKHRKKLLQKMSSSAYRSMLQKLLQITPQTSNIRVQKMGSFSKAGYHFQKIILRREGQPPLPCLLGFPTGGKNSQKLLLGLNEEGKKAILENQELWKQYTKDNNILLLADLRGIGETADPEDKNPQKYYNKEYRVAMLSSFIGKPLPGQRVQDILTLVDYSRQNEKLQSLTVEIKASGMAAEAALFATALDDRIGKIELSQTLHSFYDYLKNPLTKNQYSYVIPDALKYFDLPDIVQYIGKSKVKFDK